MNPLLSPTSSLFLPLSQLSPHCNRLLSSLSDGQTSHKEKFLFEQTLWNEVKKIRALNDASVFPHLIGYYHTILYRIADNKPPNNDLFEYHVLIRLGDLNRYMKRVDVAEYYYCNARNLFPHFGHAYNQLGLLTKPSNCFKCCYYYARAAKSTDKPLNTIADSNLRIAVIKYDCKILNHILNGEACIDIAGGERRHDKLPGTAFEWFYVIVVAIYADNIQPITKLFLSYMNQNFSTQKATTIIDNIRTTSVYCDRESYVLLACLDILLDWLKLGSRGRDICSNVSGELRDIRTCLQTTINTCRTELCESADRDNSNDSLGSLVIPTTPLLPVNNASSSSVNLQPHCNSIVQDSTTSSATDSSKTAGTLIAGKASALPHDYVLRGFGPLDCVHRELIFRRRVRNKDYIMIEEANDKNNHQKMFIDSSQLVQISTRIDLKIKQEQQQQPLANAGSKHISWHEYFMSVAQLAARRSKDPVTQVGACIVNEQNKIVATGYNGMPNGVQDDLVPWTKEGPFLDTKYAYVVHAELNAILNSILTDQTGCRLYVSLFPCNECAKAIIQSGIRQVIYMSDKHKHKEATIAAKRMFQMAGVSSLQYSSLFA